LSIALIKQLCDIIGTSDAVLENCSSTCGGRRYFSA